MSFLTALSGLNAATSNLGVISHNIANANTTGFKESRAEFADVFNGGRVGTGVQVAAVTQQFRQGSVDGTGNDLDLAINGQGFFQVKDQSGTYYTRSGQFGVDKEGFVVNSASQRLTGFQVDDNDNITGSLGELKIDNGEAPPRATSFIEFGANLNAEAEQIDTADAAYAFDPGDADTYSHSTSLDVYDSKGNPRLLSLYFIKTPNDNEWEVRGAVDGQDVQLDGAASASLGYTTQGLFAAPADGELNATVTLGTDLEPIDITLDFAQTTQFGGTSSTNALSQDGYTSGRLVGLEVADDGQVLGRYSNGYEKKMGQVALFDFRNIQGLQPDGDSNWVQTSSSGDAVAGSPQTASLGSVVSAALESSNVEMTKELVKMISAQRSFQANAQVISASDQMQQTILQTMR